MIQTLTTCSTNDVGVVVKEPSYLGTYQYSNSDMFMKNKERYIPNKECANTLQTTQKEEIVESTPNYSNLRIRKLTPLECFRLMAFSDEDYYKMKQYLSDSKLYHCMGDSIVVKVLEYIFKELIEPSKPEGNVTLW